VLSVWVGRQRSNQLECYAVQARRVVMASRMTCVRWQELEDEQILALRTELRSNRPNGSGTNKIVRSRSATTSSVQRSKVMSRPAIVATILVVALGGRQPVFAEEAISEPRCACGLSTGADVLNAGRRIFSDLVNASANERDSRIDGHAPTPQTLSRHHRHRAAADARSTAYVVITRACTPWSLPTSCSGVAFA